MLERTLLRPPTVRLPARKAPRALVIGALVLCAVSAYINLSVTLFSGLPVIGSLAPLLSVAGVLLSFPRWLLGLALAAAAPIVAASGGVDPIGTGILAVLGALILTTRGASAPFAGGVVAVVNLVAAIWYYGPDFLVGPLPSLAVVGALLTAAIGSAVRSRSEVKEGQEQHERDSRSNRELTVEKAVAEERVRIARDLHDSIGHRIAVIGMHVGAAEIHTPETASAAHDALRSARDAIRAALEDTHETLRLLRVGEEVAPGAPSAGVELLPSLVEEFRDAGLHVDFRMDDSLRDLSATRSAATFRIVQEMLTNAQRYSDGQVSVWVRKVEGTVLIASSNGVPDVAPAAVPSGGQGIVGMRERSQSLGGDVEVRRGTRRFDISARLPLTSKEDVR